MGNLSAGGLAIIRVSVSMLLLDVFSISLRLMARQHSTVKFAMDDFWVILALLLSIANIGVEFWSTRDGKEGFDTTNLPPSTLAVLLKSDYISTTLNLSTVTAVKLSVLFLYRRLFVTRNFRTVTTIVITVCIIWWLVVVLLGCFRCLPVDSIWDILVLSRWCLDYGRYFLGALISSVLLDVFILCLPIYMVRRLQLPSKRKVIISGIFLLGAGSCVAGILRITLVYSPGNIARYSRTRLEIWSTVETGIGIVCACLPTLSPLIPKNTNWSFNIKVFASSLFAFSLVSKKQSSKQPSGITKNDHGGKSGYYSNLGDNGAEEAHLAHAEGGRNLEEWSIEGSSYPLGSITVKDTVEVV